MARKILTFGVFAAVILLSDGCDAVRRFVGRPTSDMIEAKAEIVRKKEAEILKFREDSIAAADAATAKVLAAEEAARQESALVDDIRSSGIRMVDIKTVPNINTKGLDRKYYIMVGAFSMKANADKLASQARGASYSSVTISYRNGIRAVGLCPSDSFSEIFDCLQKLQLEPFCPKDVWILVNE